MKDPLASREALLEEISRLKKKNQALEKSEAMLRQAQKAHRLSDRRFRSLVEATSDWIWEISSDWKFIYASPKIKELLGYEPEEVMGKTPFDLMLPEEAERVGEVARTIATSREPFSGLENINLHKDGRAVVVETNGVPVFDEEGNYLGYRGFDRDITRRRHAEDALRTSRIRLAEAMDLARIVYWEVDPATEDFIFNDAFYAFCGTTIGQEGGYRMTRKEYVERFFHPDDRFLLEQNVERDRLRKEPEIVSNMEHRIVRRDGEVRHVLSRRRVIKDKSGNLVRVYGANQDITRQKLAEKEKERLIQELKEALSQVNRLSGLLPICSSCKKIRDNQGNWKEMEGYIREHSQADFSHSLCPECAKHLYSDLFDPNEPEI